jgi:hypothetical protein
LVRIQVRPRESGDVAQLGERRLCKPEVVGSIPIVSTRLSRSGREKNGEDELTNRFTTVECFLRGSLP